MCDVRQWLLPVEIMWRPAQMAPWFGGLNATHFHLWDFCVWHNTLGWDWSRVLFRSVKLVRINWKVEMNAFNIIVYSSWWWLSAVRKLPFPGDFAMERHLPAGAWRWVSWSPAAVGGGIYKGWLQGDGEQGCHVGLTDGTILQKQVNWQPWKETGGNS